MNKRLLSLILAVVMVLGTISIATAATGNAKVDWLIEKGLVTGDEGGYRLNESIKRSEVAAMVVRALDMEVVAETLKTLPSSFNDMNISNIRWARGYVNYAAGNNYVNGYPGGTFGPNRNITYAEVIKILVMVNGDLPDTTGYEGSLWAVPYITKALQVGITVGVVIPDNDYNTVATREKVFEMMYNTIIKKVGVNQETYKGIVVENSRVRAMDDDEITLVVFARGENSADATLRYDKDSEIRITIPSTMDPEAILGKVIDVTIDKANTATKVAVDSSYSYLNGPILAGEEEVYLDVNNETYDVLLDNRLYNSVDRIYGVYYNDEAYEYDEYVEDLGALNSPGEYEFSPEFAKVTVKGNRTFFIDSFTFEDIAPVKEIKKSGEEVYIYDDGAAAAISEVNLNDVFGYKANSFQSIELEDIKAGDVIHIYDDDKAIVRQDAKDTGDFDAIRVSSGVYYAEIDGVRYQLRDSADKKPVQALDGNAYFTLIATNAASILADLRGEEVTYQLDINDDLQLISGDLEFSEKVVVIDDIGSRDIDVVDANGTASNLKTDNFTKLLIANSNTPRTLNDFDRGDVAYLFNDGTLIDRLVKMDTATNINTNAKKVVKKSNGSFDINLSNSWIRLENGIVEVPSSANMFIVEVEGSAVTRIEAATLEDIVETAKPGTDLRAYVISESGFNGLNVGNEIRVGNATDIAHTIIFTDYVLDDELLDTETIELSFNYDPDSDDEIIGEDMDGVTVEFNVKSFANIPELKAGDIVTIFIDGNDFVVDAEVRVNEDSEVYEVLKIDRTSSRLRSITVEIDGKEEIVYVSSGVIIFGDSDVRVGDDVAFDVDEDGDIEVIAVY